MHDHATSCIPFCKKETYSRRGVVAVHFFHNHNYQGSTGKFINKALILVNRQLLSSMIDHEATQVPEKPSSQIAIHFATTTQL